METPLNTIVANTAYQRKDNYRFVIDNSSEANPIDWYNAYLEVNFNLVKTADGAEFADGALTNPKPCTTTNGQTFIKKIEVECTCNGMSVYSNTKANESANILSTLRYSKNYAESIAQDQFFFVDSSRAADGQPDQATYNSGFIERRNLTAAAAVNNISIPLNLYSYFAAFKNNLHPNLKLKIMLTLEDDDNIVFRHTGADPGKAILTKLRLWAPKIIFNEVGLKKILG